jgi:hypothetical protein
MCPGKNDVAFRYEKQPTIPLSDHEKPTNMKDTNAVIKDIVLISLIKFTVTY